MLKENLPVKSEHDFVLLVCWLLSALRSTTEYPVLSISGEQGSAKSTCAKLLRRLIDPATPISSSLLADEKEFMVAAKNSHCLSFDNLSRMSPTISDVLCRISTGSGLTARELYTDSEQITFESSNPIILNGIVDVVNAPDLADRCVNIVLPTIPPESRREISVVEAEFDKLKPELFGVLLDGLSEGLKNIASIKLDKLPRMAEFAKWSAACETVFWKQGTFANAYENNRYEKIAQQFESDPVAVTLETFMAELAKTGKKKNGVITWRGSPSDLLDKLNEIRKPRDNRNLAPGYWPTTASHLSARLNRAKILLSEFGLDIENTRTKRSRELIVKYKKPPSRRRTSSGTELTAV